MNKKSVSYGVALVALCFISSQSFSMNGNRVCMAASAAGIGYCINDSWRKAKQKTQSYDKRMFLIKFVRENESFQHILGEPMQPIIKQWAYPEMEKLEIPEYQSIPLIASEDTGFWAVDNDGFVIASSKITDNLAMTLEYRQIFLDTYNKSMQKRVILERHLTVNKPMIGIPRYSKDDLIRLNQKIKDSKDGFDACDECIALNTFFLKHEMKHFLKKDYKAEVDAYVWMPLIVQVGCSSFTYGVNKLFKINPPKTVLKTALRSSLAVGSIVPKLFLNTLGISVYCRHQETKADEFGYEHAERRLELETGRNYWQERADDYEKNRMILRAQKFGWIDIIGKIAFDLHPHPSDRAAMAQEYLDQWDQKHSIVDGVRQ